MDRLRRALIVGINSYANARPLRGCVADAQAMSKVLSRHSDQETNFECRVLLDKREDKKPITKASLQKECHDLFANSRDDVVLYFSGHGVFTDHGGYLCAYDSNHDDWGVPMDVVMRMANASRARDILMIIDCCHAGDFANPGLFAGNGQDPLALLRENTTVIAASLGSESAFEAGGHGLFTTAVIDALNGGAADIMGWVTAPGIYSYIDRRFGAFDQRPVYKSHATGVRVVRKCSPMIDRDKLLRLIDLFETHDFRYQLDPQYEPEDEHGRVKKPISKKKVAIARLFKEYRDAGLLKTTMPGEQLYWAARNGHTVELTLAGREYWWLVKNNRL